MSAGRDLRPSSPFGCVVVGLVLLASAPWGAAGDAEPRPLPGPGELLDRVLQGGERHLYTVERGRVEEMHLEVAQEGVDLAVAILDPSGARQVAVDSVNGEWGRETLLFQASESVRYQLEISSSTVGVGTGRYRLSVAPRTGDQPRDRQRRTAERAMMEAARLTVDADDHAIRQARARYGEALAVWQALGEEAEIARTLFLLAIVHRKLGDAPAGLTYLRRARAAWASLGDVLGESRALTEIGSTARSLGEDDQAEASYREAVARWRTLNQPRGLATALNYLGLVRARTAPRSAVTLYQEALGHLEAVGDQRQQGVVLNNLGGVFDLLGEPEPALAHYRQALQTHRALANRRQAAAVQNNMASIYRRTGRLQEALELYEQSRETRHQLGDTRGEARVLNNLGMTYWRLGDFDRAHDTLQAALLLRRQSQDRRGEAITLHNLGLFHAERAERDQALDLYSRALELRRTLGDRNGEATILTDMGRVAAASGEWTAAREHLEEALNLLGENGNLWRQAVALTALGEVLTASGEPRAAVAKLQRSRELHRRLGDDLGESTALLALAQSQSQLAAAAGAAVDASANLGTAYRHAAQALELLESLRADIDSLKLRSSLLSRHDRAFDLAIDLAMRLHRQDPTGGWSENALEISERARARSLLDLLKESGAGVRQAAGEDLLARQQQLLGRLNAKVERRRARLARNQAIPDAARWAAEERELVAELEKIENLIRRQSPGWDALVHPRPLRATAIQELLDAETHLLEVALAKERSFLWLVTPDRIESFELPGREVIETAAREVYERFRILDPRAGEADARAAARLSDLLLGPVASRLDAQRLVIVADGALHYLPFAALPHPRFPSEPLLVRHEVVSLPSASALAVQRQTLGDRADAAQPIAIFADPVFSSEDPRLTATVAAANAPSDPNEDPSAFPARPLGRDYDRLGWSRWEAEAIATHIEPGQATIALDFDANLEAVRGDRLRGYRIVHFATHGVIDTEHPELSALVLSLHDPAGRPRDGFLRLPEIYNLELDADLVVLSGCRTALGQEIRGEGLVGLTRGFFAAGARRLVASLWRVQDRAAAELMADFYQRILADPAHPELAPAAALRRAQLAMRSQPEHSDPYYWAAFAAYGDWR